MSRDRYQLQHFAARWMGHTCSEQPLRRTITGAPMRRCLCHHAIASVPWKKFVMTFDFRNWFERVSTAQSPFIYGGQKSGLLTITATSWGYIGTLKKCIAVYHRLCVESDYCPLQIFVWGDRSGEKTLLTWYHAMSIQFNAPWYAGPSSLDQVSEATKILDRLYSRFAMWLAYVAFGCRLLAAGCLWCFVNSY